MANQLNNNPLDDFFGNFGKDFFKSMMGGSNMGKTDVSDNKNAYIVKMDLPGFKKDGIHINYQDGTLNINATHDLTKDDDKNNVVRQERSDSNVSRSFYLPNVDKSGITADYNGGVLKINLPKIDSGKENSSDIPVN